jgi:hypothetical protein
MNTIEEIQKLKALLDQGAITKEEYNTLSKKLEPEKDKKEEEPKEAVNSDNSFQPDSELNIISNLNRLPDNLVFAGDSIQSAVGFQVASFICNFIGTVILIVSSFSMLSSIMNSRSWDRILGDNPAFIFALILFLLAFIFWVTSLVKFDKAGAFLKKTKAITFESKLNKIEPIRNIEPVRNIMESKGFKIGYKYEGGFIAYFNEQDKNVLIVSKSDLPEKMNLQQAKLACKKYNSGGYTDWFLPSSGELEALCENLHVNRIVKFKNEPYWSTDGTVNFSNNKFLSYESVSNDLNLVRPIRLNKIL